jgi:hypothetical protein
MSSKQRKKHLSFLVIDEKESGEDSTMCEEEKNAHLMDMMGHVIHIFHTFFNFNS